MLAFILKEIFTGYRMRYWLFHFSTLVMSPHGLLVCIISDEKSAVILCSSEYNVSFFFHLAILKMFSLTVGFSCLASWKYISPTLAFILLEVPWISWMCGLISFSLLSLENAGILLVLSSSSVTLSTHMLHHLSSSWYFVIFFSHYFFILCVSIWIISMDLFSGSLVFPSMVFSLQVNLLKEFFTSDIFFLVFPFNSFYSFYLSAEIPHLFIVNFFSPFFTESFHMLILGIL